MNLAELSKQLKAIDRTKLTDGQRKALGGYKSMVRNIAEEGFVGGETGVSPEGIKQAEAFAKKHGAGKDG